VRRLCSLWRYVRPEGAPSAATAQGGALATGDALIRAELGSGASPLLALAVRTSRGSGRSRDRSSLSARDWRCEHQSDRQRRSGGTQGWRGSASLVPVGRGGLVLSGGARIQASHLSSVLRCSTAQNVMNAQASTGLRPACHPALRAGLAVRSPTSASCGSRASRTRRAPLRALPPCRARRRCAPGRGGTPRDARRSARDSRRRSCSRPSPAAGPA